MGAPYRSINLCEGLRTIVTPSTLGTQRILATVTVTGILVFTSFKLEKSFNLRKEHPKSLYEGD